MNYLKARVPGITIVTDIICGFPTETEEDFQVYKPVVLPGISAVVLPGIPAVVLSGIPAVVLPGIPAVVLPGIPAVVLPGIPAVVLPGIPGGTLFIYFVFFIHSTFIHPSPSAEASLLCDIVVDPRWFQY
jgi:hypothetical protein